MSKADQLRVIGQEYLMFVRDMFSVPGAKADDSRIESLFAENLTKIANGNILFENDRSKLFPQMTRFNASDSKEGSVSGWTVYVENAIIKPFSDTNTVIVSCEWDHPSHGPHTAVAKLKCNEDIKIEHITVELTPIQSD